MKRIWKVAALAAATSLIVAACSDDNESSDTTAAEAADLKVAVVYIGVPGDAGWTYQHDQGIAELEDNLGIEVKRVENILDNADSEKTFEQLAADGYDLIFGTSFGYGDPMLAVAGLIRTPALNGQPVTRLQQTWAPTSVQLKKLAISLVSPLVPLLKTERLVTLPLSRFQKFCVASTHSPLVFAR